MELPTVFKILSDDSKYRIVKHLMNGEECVCDIAKDLNLEQSLVSHHLKKLREAGVITDRKVGSWIHCSLSKDFMEEFQGLFEKELSTTKISDKQCNSHDVCCQVKN